MLEIKVRLTEINIKNISRQFFHFGFFLLEASRSLFSNELRTSANRSLVLASHIIILLDPPLRTIFQYPCSYLSFVTEENPLLNLKFIILWSIIHYSRPLTVILAELLALKFRVSVTQGCWRISMKSILSPRYQLYPFTMVSVTQSIAQGVAQAMVSYYGS